MNTQSLPQLSSRKRVVRFAVMGFVAFISIPVLFLIAMPIAATLTGRPEGDMQLNAVAMLIATLPSLVLNTVALVFALIHLRDPSVAPSSRKFPIIVCVICSLMALYSLYSILF
ncbi:MAG: hypothetical protein ACM3KF_03100 [Acidobacteriota bacterium]